MASGKGNYLEPALPNYVLRGVAMPTVSGLYVSCHTASVADAGGGAEVSTSGTAYAREQVTRGTGAWADPTGSGSTSNVAAIVFDTATANWGTVTSIGIWDAVTGGNLLYWGDLTTPQTVNTGNRFEIAAGALVISED